MRGIWGQIGTPRRAGRPARFGRHPRMTVSSTVNELVCRRSREGAEDRSSALASYQYDLARLLSVQHQAYALGGPLHRQRMPNVWDQTGIGNEVQQRVELVQRAVEGPGDGDLLDEHAR